MVLSEVAFEWLFLARVFRREYFDFTLLEPDVETRLHAARNIREGYSLIYAVFKKRDCAVASVVQDAESSSHLFAFATVAEDSAGL